jgi:prophage tail gpP-like protein
LSTYLVPDLHPSIDKVRAVVTTKWGKSGYRPLVIHSIESYYVDTALDNDADLWTITIGDPYGEFLDMLKRDSEVRVQLFGAGKGGAIFLMTGIADEVEYDETGTIVITGRDLSSLAIDSTCPPHRYEQTKAWSIVEKQAKEIGFRHTKLARGNMVKKVQNTDGNETYWEFWYRLYRKEKMWVWTEPTGVLVADKLDYGNRATYHFGTPKKSEPRITQALYIPVERVDIRKTTQSRVWEVWVYFQRGDNGDRIIARDPQMDHWIKKPRRILQDTEARTTKSAQKLAWNEIFEGKVGSIELKLTIPDPGFPIKPNRTAIVRIPEIGIVGDFFVVGARYQGGPEGFVQEIRLREKQYSLSRRVPADPKLPDTEPRSESTISDLANDLSMIASDMPEKWGQYFVDAAKNFHGPWDYTLFLATLLGICDEESGFQNKRQDGGPGGNNIEWYPWNAESTGPPTNAFTTNALGQPGPLTTPTPKRNVPIDTNGRSKDEWEEIFANEPGRYTNKDWSVGPMQLKALADRRAADEHMLSPESSPATATEIDAYLKRKGSPIAGHGSTFVSAGVTWNVDPRLMVAIAGAETSFGTDPKAANDVAHFNAWGYGPHNQFTSWDNAINTITSDLGRNYINAGKTTVALIGATWAPGGAANDPTDLNSNWVNNTSGFLRALDGDPDDVTNPKPTGPRPQTPVRWDEYAGGRWHPQHNIWIAAEMLAGFLKKMVGDSGRDIDMWAGVSAYGHHNADENAATVPTRYAVRVKNRVFNDPGYLAGIKDSISQSRETALANADGESSAISQDSEGTTDQEAPKENEILNFFNTEDLDNP